MGRLKNESCSGREPEEADLKPVRAECQTCIVKCLLSARTWSWDECIVLFRILAGRVVKSDKGGCHSEYVPQSKIGHGT